VITVGSFNFPESVLLAYLYAGALSAQGYPVRVLADLGSRELVEPVLIALDAQVELDGRYPRAVAERWLSDQGLTGYRRGAS
jgi:osmoprotectant transport system substrate-binding protein